MKLIVTATEAIAIALAMTILKASKVPMPIITITINQSRQTTDLTDTSNIMWNNPSHDDKKDLAVAFTKIVTNTRKVARLTKEREQREKAYQIT